MAYLSGKMSGLRGNALVLINWSTEHNCFELKFQEFQGDLAAAKASKFKCTGPPDWVWYTDKTACLKYLQKNRPASGLEITQQALSRFQELSVQQDKNDELRKRLKDEKKKQKKVKIDDPTIEVEVDEFEPIKVETKSFTYINKYKPPKPPDERCVYCSQPVYFYEYTTPIGVCLWCDKTIRDFQGDDEESA